MPISNTKSFRIFKIAYHLLAEIGFNPLKTLNSIKGFPVYTRDFIQFSIANRKAGKFSSSALLFPCLTDRYEGAGSLDHHYFQQDLWAARKIHVSQAEKHVDVGSRVDGFVAHVLAFRDVEILDIRELTSDVKGLTFRQADLMQTGSVPEAICDSLSCLHALEHFGLGRYGDPLDPSGHIKGLESLTKLLKLDGKLLLSVPVGRERIEFNAHRIFSVKTILSLTQVNYELLSFSYIDDQGVFHENFDCTKVPEMVYGCGMFELKKIK